MTSRDDNTSPDEPTHDVKMANPLAELLDTLNQFAALENELEDKLKMVNWNNIGASKISRNLLHQLELRVPARVDGLSGLMLCHLSLIMRMFLPGWALRGPMSMWQERLVHASQGDDDGVTELRCAGSLPDGISVPTYKARNPELCDPVTLDQLKSDIDILLMVKRALTADQIDTSRTYPGYFRITEPYFDIIFRSLPDLVLSRMNKGTDEDIFVCGPALTSPELDPTSIFEHVDRVPTYQFTSWPESAVPWITRHRLANWPPKHLIQEIAGGGCHLVNKSHPLSLDPDGEWRFSFVIAEQKLIRSLSLVQRQSYIICKLLVKYLLNPAMAFSSYCVKTAFLWTLECMPEETWTRQNAGLSLGVLTILDKMMYFLAEYNVPMYFIPEGNLVEHVMKASIRRNLETLTEFRRDPLQTILKFDSAFVAHLGQSPGGKSRSITDAFHPNSPYSLCTIPGTMKTCLRQQYGLIRSTFLYHLKTHNILGASEAARELQHMESAMSYAQDEQHVSWLMEQFNIYHTQWLHEIHRSITSDSCIGDILGGMAAIISLAFLENINEEGTKSTSKQILECFEIALGLESNARSAHLTYYAFFLKCLGNTDKTLPLLEEAVLFRPYGEEFMSMYVYALRNTQVIEPELLRLIIHHIAYFTPPMFAFYQLVIIHNEHDVCASRAILETFESYCEKHAAEAPDWRHRLYNVLGCTYRAIGDVENATRSQQIAILLH